MPEINSVAGQLVGIPMGQVYTAGPGIKIDNVNKVVSVDETVLYTHTTVASSAVNDVLLMAEPVTNFERIRVEFWNREFNERRITNEFYTDNAIADTTVFVASYDASTSANGQQRVNMLFSLNSDGNLVDKGHNLCYSTSSYTSANNRGLGIHRVVGINHITSA